MATLAQIQATKPSKLEELESHWPKRASRLPILKLIYHEICRLLGRAAELNGVAVLFGQPDEPGGDSAR
jgi:hypothetical protein